MQRYLSRKFLLSLLIIVCATVLVFIGRISDVAYSTIVLAVMSFYNIANVVQKKIQLPVVVEEVKNETLAR